jgi:predicted acyl esterase
LHTRGSIQGFERISSTQKWLFTHGRKEWETFYGHEALAWQKRFLDHFLKDIDNGMDQVPQVRLELRKAFYQQDVRSEPNWPLASVKPTRLYLCANSGSLKTEPADSEGKLQYRSTGRDGNATFPYRFDTSVELIGSMRLKLWISTSEGDDLDIFVVLRKLDSNRREIFFSGFNGYQQDGVAKGWLRASHRELDPSRTTPLRPWHSHTQIQKLPPGDVVPVEIEIWPSATLFEAESTLQLTIQGHDAANYPAFGHRAVVNRGLHTIFTGGRYDSFLAIPLNKSEAPQIPLAGRAVSRPFDSARISSLGCASD